MASKNPIFSTVTNFVAPFVFLFVCYTQLNGENAPGGGFQAGAIFASLLMALDLAIGIKIKTQHLTSIASAGILTYILPGIISMGSGLNFLNYNVLARSAVHGQQIGIFVVEIGIGLVVSSILYLIYKSFMYRLT